MFQIIPPHDKGISSSILDNLTPLESSWNTSILKNNEKMTDPYNEIHQAYMNDILKVSYSR